MYNAISNLKHHIKMVVYRIGRKLMHINYVKTVNCVEHDLRCEVAELKKELNAAKIEITILKVRRWING